MKKIVAWFKVHKRISLASSLLMMASCLALSASAVEGSSTVSSDLGTFIDSIKGALGDFTTTNLATILVASLSLTVGLAIAWFAFRFIKGKVSSALKKGKI